MPEGKPKVAFYWCSSCGGCEESVVDLAEDILAVTAAVDIVFWPVALDFKKKDLEALPDKSIAVAFINGAIRMSEQEEMAHLLRRKAGLVVAHGACAHLGGIPGHLPDGLSRHRVDG
jgi:F420-non-reducing hydrogenase small subunit